MTDVVVAPHGDAWTVRHPRRLHERFASRAEALRTAAAHARQLARDGDACRVHLSSSALARRPERRSFSASED